MIEKGRAKYPSPQKRIMCNKISLLLIDPFLGRSGLGWEESFEIDRMSTGGPDFNGPVQFQCGAL